MLGSCKSSNPCLPGVLNGDIVENGEWNFLGVEGKLGMVNVNGCGRRAGRELVSSLSGLSWNEEKRGLPDLLDIGVRKEEVGCPRDVSLFSGVDGREGVFELSASAQTGIGHRENLLSKFTSFATPLDLRRFVGVVGIAGSFRRGNKCYSIVQGLK